MTEHDHPESAATELTASLAPDQALVAPAEAGGRYAPRVIIAEDEALIRLDLKEMLIEEGYDVCAEASDGQEAIDFAVELRPDLVILDVKMPGVDGLAAAERICADKIAPVVILTAFSQRELVVRARDAGVMGYLVKPFQKSDLVPAIEMAVARFAQMRALDEEVAELGDRLETRKLVDRAKAALMAEHKLSEAAAFRWIQQSAMERRTTMKAVAVVVLENIKR